MDVRVKELWMNALDTYDQGKEVLRTKDDTYCCLGVLCDIYREDTGLGEWVLLFPEYYSFKTETASTAFFLPREVRNWAGLDDEGPWLIYNGAVEEMIVLNDGNSRINSLTFSEIKELIRENL